MKQVILRAPILTKSGYGEHSRQIARWLLKREEERRDITVKFATLPWGDTPWSIERSGFNDLTGIIMDRSVKPDAKCDVSVQLQLPNEWDASVAPVCIGVTAGVETDRCYPKWVDACNRMTAIVVPSQHTLSTLQSSGKLAVPAHVVPEAYVDDVARNDLPPLNVDFAAPFNFLVFGQLTGNNPENDRKNTFWTIRWLCEAFRGRDDVGIVLKTNVGRNSRIDRSITKNILTGVLNEFRAGGTTPKASLLHGDMSPAEVAALYRHPKVKALVALTRGEGFGLPILEAAASGLPVIATGWSGHMDFMKHGKFVNVSYTMADVHPSRVDENVFVKGARWANPSGDDAKRKLLKFHESPSTPREWARELREKLLPTYSFDAVCKQWDAAIGGLL